MWLDRAKRRGPIKAFTNGKEKGRVITSQNMPFDANIWSRLVSELKIKKNVRRILVHTCGGGDCRGVCVMSVSKGHVYLSGFSLLAKLQSYILLSSSEDKIE